jgi:hypothetical protein
MRCRMPGRGYQTHCLFQGRTHFRLGALWGRGQEEERSCKPFWGCWKSWLFLGSAGSPSSLSPLANSNESLFFCSKCGGRSCLAPPEGWVQTTPREFPAPNHYAVVLLPQALWQELGTRGWTGRWLWWASFGGQLWSQGAKNGPRARYF